MSKQKPLRVAVSTYEFVHLPGARDLLRMIVRGLKLKKDSELYLLVDAGGDNETHRWSNSAINAVQKFVRIPHIAQRILRRAELELRRRLPLFAGPGAPTMLQRQMADMLGTEIVEGLRILPYCGGGVGIEPACRHHNIDVVIPTTYSMQMPFVSYLYDCQHKYFPENFSPNDIALRDRLFRKLIDESPAMIVNSEHAKQDLIKFFHADQERIIALPFTPQLSAGTLQARPELLEKYRLPRKFFLISNQFWVHKSLETALEALELLVDEGVSECHIVFTGEMQDTRFPEYVPGLMKRVEEMGLREQTTFLGYIPKRDQLEIMKHCVAIVQTTLFEGGPGGGSVFDAVSVGVRAIVSAIPINHELPVGDDLVLFEPKNSLDLAAKMRLFWNSEYHRPDDSELGKRAERLLKGYSDCLYGAIKQAIFSVQSKPHTPGPVKISVVTAVKNAATDLAKTMKSVFDQGYQNVEYIVVDGGSDDGTADIVKSYGEKVIYISEPDEGIYDAMNKGIAAAAGDVLYFLNAGDVLYDRHVLTDVVSIIGDPAYQKYGFFYGNVQFVRPDGTEGRYLEYNPFPFYYYADNCQCHQVCFYRREMFERYGHYDTSFKVYGDQEFNARLVVKHQVPSFYMGRLIVRYREGGFSEEMLSSGLNAAEKKRIQKRYFGDTPDWFFERLKMGY